MKKTGSITIEEGTIIELDSFVEEGIIHNKPAFEFVTNKLLEKNGLQS